MDTPTLTPELREALRQESAPTLERDVTDAIIESPDCATIDDVPVINDSLDLSFNPVEHHERMVVGTLREDAGNEHTDDEFSRRTLREITQDLRHDGHRPGAIIVPSDGMELFDGARLQHTDDSPGVSDVNFHGWSVVKVTTPDVLDAEAFVIAEDALTVPAHAPVPMLVRYPDGVTHYRFGGD
jgi:hypothetical protein